MTPITVSRAHPAIRAALAATFPAYKGRKVRIARYERPVYCQTTWSEGSRDVVKAVRLSDGLVADAANLRGWGAAEEVPCPAGHMLVVHSVAGTADLGITFYVRDDELSSPTLRTLEA